jgi:predicted Fe-S protein YdhL (DUF1289 family)
MSMSETIIAPTWRARIADPKPAFCSGCMRGADAQTVFVDLWMPIERGFLREFGSQAVVAELNRLVLCDACVREMAECLAFEPALHRSQQAQIAAVVADRDQLRKENYHLRALVAEGIVKPGDDEGWDDESWDREKD